MRRRLASTGVDGPVEAVTREHWVTRSLLHVVRRALPHMVEAIVTGECTLPLLVERLRTWIP
jgi:hypothetical protein